MKAILLIVSILSSSLVFAADKKKNVTTKQVMDEVFQSFINLLPYAASEMKFRDPKSGPYIVGNLNKITGAFKNARHLKTFKSPNFKPSFEVVQSHLEQTLEAFNSNNKIFARTRLKATTQICMSCHTQLGNKKLSSTFKAINVVNRGYFQSDIEYADFLFLTRSYTRSLRYYEQEITKRLSKNKELRNVYLGKNTHYSDFTVEKSLGKILEIYTKIYFKPQKAIDILSKYKNKENISKNIKDSLTDWLNQLEEWKKRKFSGKVSNEKQLRSFIAKNLKPIEASALGDGSEDITLLISSGVLYRYLNFRPNSDMAPEILFWLSKIDRQFSQTYFYSLADIYLKQCVMNYPKNPYARKCYQEYKDSIIFGYTGSSGVNIPKEEREALRKLKAYLKN